MAVNVPAKIVGSDRSGLYGTPGQATSAAVSFDDKYVIIGTVVIGNDPVGDPVTGAHYPIASLQLQGVTIEDHPKFIAGGNDVALLAGPYSDLVGVELGQPASTVLERAGVRTPVSLWPFRAQFEGNAWQLGVIAVGLTPTSDGGDTGMDFTHAFTDQWVGRIASDGSPSYSLPVAVAYPDQAVADFTVVYADLGAVASYNYVMHAFGSGFVPAQGNTFGYVGDSVHHFPFYRSNGAPQVSAAPLGNGFAMTGDNQVMRVWKTDSHLVTIPDIDGGPLGYPDGTQRIPRLSAGLDAPHETEVMLSNNDLSRRALVHTDGTLYPWVDGTPQSRDDLPIPAILDQGAWIEPNDTDPAARTRYRWVEKFGTDVAGTPALIASDPTGGYLDDYLLMLPRTGYAMGFHPPGTLYMFRMPDRTVTVQPYLRMSQRNDGDGINRHPRLDTSHDAATSTQRGVTPRLARSNRYQ